MSDPNTPDVDDLDVQDVISAYLLANPTPTDESLHNFAKLLGFDYEDFETLVFKMLAEELEDADEEDIDDVIEDPLDLFLVTLFSWLDAPTEEQVHSLATMLEMEPAALEERLYALLSGLTSEGGDASE